MRRARKIRTGAVVGVVTLGLLAPVASRPASASGPLSPAPLATFGFEAGDAAFWDGPSAIHAPAVETAYDIASRGGSSRQAGDAICALHTTRCIDYGIEVLERAWRLRVAFETPDDFDLDHGDSFDLFLYDPAGNLVDSAGQQLGVPVFHRFSDEVYAENPALGLWTARVFVYQATEATLRMRAKLETEPAPEGARRILLPNLRTAPPFDFTFDTPLTPSMAGHGPTLPGSPTRGCTTDEMVDFEMTRCLRFSVGPENIGDGALLLRFEPGKDPLHGQVTQIIDYTSGDPERRPAGTYEYDVDHGHYHHAGFHGMDLFRVTDTTTGAEVWAGDSKKHGYCMGEYLIAQWERFANDPPGEASTCLEPALGTTIGVAAGWADIYPYRVPGNAVDFGDNPDGHYIVRVRVNKNDSLHESNRDDNTSYAYVAVQGDTITVLERGYGLSPWDPNKVVADDMRPPNAA